MSITCTYLFRENHFQKKAYVSYIILPKYDRIVKHESTSMITLPIEGRYSKQPTGQKFILQ